MRSTKKLLFFLALTGTLFIASCSQSESINEKPELEQIKKIAQLNTIEVYYHNVAKLTKPAGEGFWSIGKTDRDYWVEYVGKAEIGIDFEKLNLERNGNEIKITIPGAVVGEPIILPETYDTDRIYTSKDNFLNKNTITPEDQKTAISDAQKAMEENIWQNSSLLRNAQERAENLIKAYIESIGEAAGVHYDIIFDPLDNIIPAEIQERIDAAAQEEN